MLVKLVPASILKGYDIFHVSVSRHGQTYSVIIPWFIWQSITFQDLVPRHHFASEPHFQLWAKLLQPNWPRWRHFDLNSTTVVNCNSHCYYVTRFYGSGFPIHHLSVVRSIYNGFFISNCFYSYAYENWYLTRYKSIFMMISLTTGWHR